MSDFNNFHAYKSTGGGSGGGGCFSWKTIIIIAVICELLTLFGKCSG